MKKTERKKLTDGREVEIASYSNGEMEIFELKPDGQRIDLVEGDEFETLAEGLHYVQMHTESDQAGRVHLEKLLKESKLPDVAKERLQEQFKDSEGTDGMKEAIEAEGKYLAKVAAGKVRGLGDSDGAGDEARFDERKKRFERMGLTPQEAEIAAIGRDGRDPRKHDRKRSFQKMGLSEAEAVVAARGRP